jgi:hypothetical protein
MQVNRGLGRWLHRLAAVTDGKYLMSRRCMVRTSGLATPTFSLAPGPSGERARDRAPTASTHPARCLTRRLVAELLRVMRPGGRVHLWEHLVAESRGLARVQ